MMKLLSTREVQTEDGTKQVVIELQGALETVMELMYDYVYTVNVKKKLPYKPKNTKRKTISCDISKVIIR